jgi:hypothetical protein
MIVCFIKYYLLINSIYSLQLVLNNVLYCFLRHMQPSLVFATEFGALHGFNSKDGLFALPADIRLGWKCLANENAKVVIINIVKSCVVQTPSPYSIKLFSSN